MVLLKIVSDLHLNKPGTDVQHVLSSIKSIDRSNHKSHTTVLAILGDVGSNFEELFKHVATLEYDHVLFVAGNHDYYNRMLQRQNVILGRLCEKYGVTFLNRTSVIIDDVTFLGATLWTDIPTRLRTTAFDHLKEIKLIKYGLTTMTLDRYIELHKRDVSWIVESLNVHDSLIDNGKIVVLTHHSPSFKLCQFCSQGESSDDINVYFASHLDNLVKRVALWCCGHIHESRSVNNMIVNAYPARNYNPDLVINTET